MSSKQKMLVFVGFFITAGSMVLSTFFIARSNGRSAKTSARIACLQEAREFGRANLIESSSNIYFASIMFTLSEVLEQAGNFENTQKNLATYTKKAIRDALEFKRNAIGKLDSTENTTCDEPDDSEGTAGQCDMQDFGALVDRFESEFIHLRKMTGPAKQAAYDALLATYDELRRADEVCRSEWADRDAGVRDEIEALADTLREQMGFAGLLGQIGTGLSILGLMVVLARDLVG